MTTEQKIIKTKVGVLELAKQLGNVKRAGRDHGLQSGQLLSVQGAV
jgi:hypothetical protein